MADSNGNGLWKTWALVLATGFVTFVGTMTYARTTFPPTYTQSEIDLKFKNLGDKIDDLRDEIRRERANGQR
jgi:hypothetical protein